MEQLPDLNSNSTSNSTSNTSKPPKAKRISISILGISLPFLYVSLLHVPPSTLFQDTTFWFLISNSIIIIVAADSGVFSSSGQTTNDLYDEFLKYSRARSSCLVSVPPLAVVNEKESSNETKYGSCLVSVPPPAVVNEKENSKKPNNASCLDSVPPLAVVDEKESSKEPKDSRSRSKLAVGNCIVAANKLVPQTVTEKRNCGVEECEYWKMSNEELNRRVEDFIRRFNREIRLQEMTR